MQIFLIRHPQPSVAASVCYGQKDLALSEQALQQLDSTAENLRRLLPTGIPVYSSPLLRCRLLAEKLHTAPIFDERLKEMHFGRWEMRLWDRLPREQLDAWAQDPFHYVTPEGESVAQLQERVLAFIEEKQSVHKTMAIVTHAGVMKTLFAQAKQLPPTEWMKLHFDYASVHQLEWATSLQRPKSLRE